jgi:integrase/recombinase XerD
MGKSKINWHLRPVSVNKTDVILKKFEHYLKELGLRQETVNLYIGRVGAFLNQIKNNLPNIEAADKYRSRLIGDGKFSRSHINNTCFAIKKFYQMNEINWNFTVLKPDEGIPYYFDEQDVMAIFSVCSNIKHLAMLQTLFYGCLRSSELSRLDDKDLNMKSRTIRLRVTKGGRDDIACINTRCVETLEEYLKIRPQMKIGNRNPSSYMSKLDNESWFYGI